MDAATILLPESKGKIDLHCHLLPGVDDGCQTPEQTVACIRRWLAMGFVGAVCTPHVGPKIYEHNTPDEIAERLPLLRQHLDRVGIEFQLWDGGEVRIMPDTIEWFSFWGLPTLGASRCVLLDWWGHEWPQYCYDTCQYLLDNGYQPILAHPERMSLADDLFDEVVDKLLSNNVWLQGNLNSLGGGESELAKARAEKLLADDAYFVMASDTHNASHIESRIEGIRAIERKLGKEGVALMLEERPRQVLNHGVHRDEPN